MYLQNSCGDENKRDKFDFKGNLISQMNADAVS